MRILLISGIVFVHVPFDPATSAYTGANGLFDWFRVFLGDSLFRIGVPCLSAISGYLLFRRGTEGFDYRQVLRSKARTVLLPFLLWNLGTLAVVLVVQRAGMGIGYFPDLWSASARDLLDYAFATETFPVDIPLYFLRDLVVCIMLSPVLAFLVKRFPAPTLVVLFVAAVLPDIVLYVVLKKSILFSFTFGIFLALNKVDLKIVDHFALAGTMVMLAAAVLLSFGLYKTGPDYPWGLDLARNVLSIAGAGGFWMLSALAIRSRLGQRLAATGSLSFWVFCGHYPLLVVMWMVWKKVAGDELYPAFYLASVVIAISLLVATNALFSRRLPAFYEVMTGSRGRKARIAQSYQPSHAGALNPASRSVLTQQKR